MAASPAAAQIQPKTQPKTSTAMETLQAFLEERRRSKAPVLNFEEFESKLHALMNAAECDALGEELERFDLDVPVVGIGGVAYRQVVRCEATYFAPAGPVRVMRSLYSTRTEPGEKALCPMELGAGVVDGKWTPRAAKQALWFVAQMTPRTVEDLYERLGGLTPSKAALDRLPRKLSAGWEAKRELFETVVRAQEQVPAEVASVGISLDGVLIPTKDGERKEEEKRQQLVAEHEGDEKTGGPVGYEEVGCGTLTFYDKEGELVSTIRLARMPENKKATLKTSLTAELKSVLEQRPDLKVVRLADGAKDNWTYLDELAQTVPIAAEGPSVLDFWHAADHLDDALGAAYGQKSTQCRAQYEKLRHVLRHDLGGVEKIIRALVFQRDEHPRNRIIKKELKYFRKNRHRMNYATVAAQGLPIGTGSTEAACKTLAVQRMKCSGMTGWTDEGGQAILTFRALIQSDRFDAAWDLLACSYKRDIVIPDNVIPLRRGARTSSNRQ